MRRVLAAVLAIGLLASGACHGVDRSVSYPDARDPGAIDSVPHRGFKVRVRQIEGGALEGELIAADTEAVWIEGADGDLRRIPFAKIRRIVIPLYRRGPVIGTASAWSGALLLSTITHGWWLVVTMPVAAAVGGVAIAITAVESRVVLVAATFEHAWRYARFPQGMPEGWLLERARPQLDGDSVMEPLPEIPPPSEAAEPQAPRLPGPPPASVDPFDDAEAHPLGEAPQPESAEDIGEEGPAEPERAEDGGEEDPSEVEEPVEDAADGSVAMPPIQRPSKAPKP